MKQNKKYDISVCVMFVTIIWFNTLSLFCFHTIPSISCSDVSVTPLINLLSIFVKWHIISTDLLSIVHFPVCLANVLSIVCFMILCSVLLVSVPC